jgi:hypothetical protein
LRAGIAQPFLQDGGSVLGSVAKPGMSIILACSFIRVFEIRSFAFVKVILCSCQNVTCGDYGATVSRSGEAR